MIEDRGRAWVSHIKWALVTELHDQPELPLLLSCHKFVLQKVDDAIMLHVLQQRGFQGHGTWNRTLMKLRAFSCQCATYLTTCQGCNTSACGLTTESPYNGPLLLRTSHGATLILHGA